MTKTIIHVLIACALGLALGLLWDSGQARAANEYTGPVISHDGIDWQGYNLCNRVSRKPDICVMTHSTEGAAREWAFKTLDGCDSNDPRWIECAASRAYIKQRWGY